MSSKRKSKKNSKKDSKDLIDELGEDYPIALFHEAKLSGFVLLKDLDLQRESNIVNACPDPCGRGCSHHITSFRYSNQFCERCDVYNWREEGDVQDVSSIKLPEPTMTTKNYKWSIEEEEFKHAYYFEPVEEHDRPESAQFREDMEAGDVAKIREWIAKVSSAASDASDEKSKPKSTSKTRKTKCGKAKVSSASSDDSDENSD